MLRLSGDGECDSGNVLKLCVRGGIFETVGFCRAERDIIENAIRIIGELAIFIDQQQRAGREPDFVADRVFRPVHRADNRSVTVLVPVIGQQKAGGHIIAIRGGAVIHRREATIELDRADIHRPADNTRPAALIGGKARLVTLIMGKPVGEDLYRFCRPAIIGENTGEDAWIADGIEFDRLGKNLRRILTFEDAIDPVSAGAVDFIATITGIPENNTVDQVQKSARARTNLYTAGPLDFCRVSTDCAINKAYAAKGKYAAPAIGTRVSTDRAIRQIYGIAAVDAPARLTRFR